MSRSLPDGRPVVTQAMIESGLREVGLDAGAVVVAHSALRSFGWVEEGEDAVIDALIAGVGPMGTVCMPALSYGDYGPRRPPPPFDPRATPGIVGRIPERFRGRPGVRRSLHPTHSLAAFGARAEELLKGHERSPTPCGPDSPWGRIARAGGHVLMLGVGTFYCTMFHGPEEEVEPDARCTRPVPCRIVTEAGERTVYLRLHQSYEGAVSDRAAMEGVLEAEGLLRRTRVGNSTLLLIDAQGLWDLSLRLLRARPARAVDNLWVKVRHDFRRIVSDLRRAL
ncbi:MAG: hypothetical protein A3F84_20960 [Candidatus Handelsmanbacteria bacterium RIFCSPLOWO2_12_FULL_64_10]|uniref:Aminoglycoside N(3)-acetyltransferase n=1 Tax=Handelsmanbacteria sp. (strain RIFCSPLOWO2_12_FULL_64_10) TaxID=1817868 RepID=A0A1F6CDE0_HANXR|nr:MAG: hypothetical protein A3F84_20960 [Candidatus Handelsmanbacteria bacterium RIFCSPLOWO2_12_FULL_64_10]